MSVWTHVIGGISLGGLFLSDNDWNTASNKIKSYMFPMLFGSEGQLRYKIKMNEPYCIHFADVLIVGDLRNVDNYEEFEKWLLRFTANVYSNGWHIRNGSFQVSVEYTGDVCYYFENKEERSDACWRKIDNPNGVLVEACE